MRGKSAGKFITRARARAAWAAASLLAGLLACNLPGASGGAPTAAPTVTSSPYAQAGEAAQATLLSEAPLTPPALPPTATNHPDDPIASPAPPVVESVTTTSEGRGAVTLVTTTTIARYAVDGATAEEIEVAMWANGPTDALGGYHWWALTEPLFDWRTACECGEQGCTSGPVTMYLSVRYTLPRWPPPEGAAELLRSQWGTFVRALETHERGHGALAAECAWSLGEAFTTLPPQPSCEAVGAAVRAASNEVFAACRAAQRAYENETNRGRTQGVIWPP